MIHATCFSRKFSSSQNQPQTDKLHTRAGQYFITTATKFHYFKLYQQRSKIQQHYESTNFLVTCVNFYVKELIATYCRLSAVCSVLLGQFLVNLGVGWKSKGKLRYCDNPVPHQSQSMPLYLVMGWILVWICMQYKILHKKHKMHMKGQYNISLLFYFNDTLISQTNDCMGRSCSSHLTELASSDDQTQGFSGVIALSPNQQMWVLFTVSWVMTRTLYMKSFSDTNHFFHYGYHYKNIKKDKNN